MLFFHPTFLAQAVLSYRLSYELMLAQSPLSALPQDLVSQCLLPFFSTTQAMLWMQVGSPALPVGLLWGPKGS